MEVTRAAVEGHRAGKRAVGEHRVDLQIGVTKRDAVVVFQNQENVAAGQVFLAQTLADFVGQVSVG